MPTPADLGAAALTRWRDRLIDLSSQGVILDDLRENAARVQAHPIVQILAGAPATLPKATPIDETDLDDRQDPQATYHILDADGSQRLALSAAAQGESLVLVGPPGTGKSQTIANLIADQIAHGKTVLFVSANLAALDVVYQRLSAAGLREFCLDLRSQEVNKTEVINELARCQQEKLTPQPTPSADDFACLKQRCDQLNQYVRALHRKREPMQKSVWDALAELPRWHDLPAVPLHQASDTMAQRPLTEYTSADLDELQQRLQRLQHHWHIRTDKNFPWRGFKAERYSLQLRDEVVGLIDKIRARGDKLRSAAQQFAQSLGVNGSVADLLRLGDLLEKRPGHTQASWLTTANLEALSADFEKCADQYQRLGQSRKPLNERYGAVLWKLPHGSAAAIEQAWKKATPLLTPGDERGAAFLKAQHKLSAWAAETQKRVPTWLTELRTLEKWLAVPLPVGAGSNVASSHEMKLDPSVAGLRAFVRLATLGVGDAPPDKVWLEDRQVAKDALALITASKPAFHRYKQNRVFLLKTYDAKLFDLDLGRIGQAYTGWYRNGLCIFSWQYRKDRRAIAKTRPLEDIPPTVADDMQRGAELHADRAKLNAEEAERKKLLGRYEKGLDTDIEAAERAAKHAVEAFDLAGVMKCDRLPAKCVEALCAGSAPEKIRAAVKRLNESFVAWAHQTQELQAILPTASVPGVGALLEETSLSALVQYAKQLQAALNQFAGLADPLLGANAPADAAAFVADLKQADELLAWEVSQATEAERWTKQLGSAFQGVGTDWDNLRKAITWARRVRECLGVMQAGNDKGPASTSDALIRAVAGTPPSSRELRHALTPYEQELHHLEVRFDTPGPTFEGKPLRQYSPDTVLDLLTKWRERVGELADWVDWRYLPERFGHLGLKSFWEHLQQHDVVKERVVELFLKSFWTAWLDATREADPALQQYQREEHEQRLQEFRALDRKIVEQGGARIRAVIERTRSERGPEAELEFLMKEAETAALPTLRDLFGALPSLLMQFKPCLLLSPLSVSQHLPGSLQFDLVVFDEASQLLPEDAIGGIYRGKQLVVVGDNQQPASPGEAAPEEVPPPESLLSVCLSAGLPMHTLRWRHGSSKELPNSSHADETDVSTDLTGLHEDVLRELKKLGFDGASFVECGWCRLDIGVRDPKQAGRFLLGIEFDGPMYAQSATAGERERLRFEELQRLGWKLHRIAAHDWVARRDEEIMRLRAALSVRPS